MEHIDDICSVAKRLFEQNWEKDKPVRLLGITLQNLLDKDQAAVQLDLFDYPKQQTKERLTEVMDRIRDKYGESALLTAGMLGNDPSTTIRNHKERGTSLQTDFLGKKDNG
jgi:DNA polymerase-4